MIMLRTTLSLIIKAILLLFISIVMSMLLVIIGSLGYAAFKDPQLFIGQKKQ